MEQSGQASPGEGWIYSRVPPGDVQSGGAAVMSTMQSTGAAGGNRRPPGKLPWLVPVGVLFGAVFIQNAGLYSATCTYVRWMDEFSEAEQRSSGSPSIIEDVVLEDPLAELLGSWRFPPVPDVPWRPEAWAEALTTIVSLVWLGWVARSRDLQSWTKVMLAGAALAALKGVLAWATALPDAAGWRGCRARLGEDGLAYFREVGAGGTDGGGPPLGSLQATQDIAMLSLSSMWMMGRLGRQRVCADTIFSTPTCFTLLLSMAVYDLARSCTQELEAVRRSTIRSIVGLALGVVLAVHLALTLLSPQHYTMDVAIAFPLTMLVYTSPVIALATKRWMDEWAAAMWSMLVTAPSEVLLPEAPEAAPAEADPAEAGLYDVGEATIPPCCLPFCSLSGMYHMRAQPGSPNHRPWTDECERRYRQQLAEFRELREGFDAPKRRLKEDIEKESKRIQEHEAELRASSERRIAEERRRVAEREQATLGEATAKLRREREATAGAEAKAADVQQRLDTALVAFGEIWGKLSGEADDFKSEATEALAECEQHRRSLKEAARLREVLRRAAGDAAAAAEEEKQVEALMAIPEPTKDADVNGNGQEEPSLPDAGVPPPGEAPVAADGPEGEDPEPVARAG